MSGAEVITVLGLISSVITIIETSRDVFDAASSADGLHEAFRAVSQNIPLVLTILRDCKTTQELVEQDYSLTVDEDLKHDIEESNKAVKPLIQACQDDAKQLQQIFQKVVPEDDTSRVERYKKAARAVLPGKKRKVEDLMKNILEKLQLLHTSRFFKSENERTNENRSKELDTAITQLSELSPSLRDNESQYNHHGSGGIFIHPGNGTQNNYNQSGGSGNKQYNAGTLNIGRD
ncbi:hypothetical protein KC367_g8101 [Hortaea werneckii]|nr:hypothetical protein KC361_g7394 [Hortaea werneckii]KAI7183639.1 hypothetical protein KC363_g8144 [Hortaea werneckii]KAI7392454.1 hypothetical protein KC336_g16522 [Hortaea werneckii]KAI7494301.1 hypothetical protein KC367_g8101 [Hortaea werneckii]KAI7505936.1 hypothetical protein KC347_g7809 [Hortaea werneckii]